MNKELTEFWGSYLNPLMLSGEVEKLLLPQTALFLKSIGLPSGSFIHETRRAYLGKVLPQELKWIQITDNLIKQSRPFFELAESASEVVVVEGNSYIPIGHQGQSKVVIRTESDNLYLLHGERPSIYPPSFSFHPIQFLNSTIEALLQFLMIVIQYEARSIEPQQRYSAAIEDKSDSSVINVIRADIYRNIADIEKQFEVVDKDALSDGWWRVYLQELYAYV